MGVIVDDLAGRLEIHLHVVRELLLPQLNYYARQAHPEKLQKTVKAVENLNLVRSD